MKTILVPTDFSPGSMQALNFALKIAQSSKAEIALVHIINQNVISESTFGLQPYYNVMEHLLEEERNASEEFDKIGGLIPPSAKVIFRTFIGEVISRITLATNDLKADLILMSTHGASDLGEFMLGSKVEKIIRDASVPLLAIPRNYSFKEIKSILFPNTLSLNQVELLKEIKELQRIFNAVLHILLINTPEKFHNDEDSTKLLRDFVDFYELENCTTSYRNNEHEREGIISFANEINADMIALGTHGRKGISHFFKGSIAEEVLNRVDQPVWIYNCLDK
jgi:nucleotide-binding universal stress UspA family protein